MGNLTISLDDQDEKQLRMIARKKYANRKGSLSKVISESLHALEKASARERAMKRQFSLMDKGFAMGKITAKTRADLYER